MHADDNWLWSFNPSDGHAKIMLKLGNILIPLRRIAPLTASDGGDLRANHAVVDEIQAEHRHASIVARVLQVAIYKNPGEILPRTGNKIHREKSDVADDINVAQCGVKLNAVKGDDTGW